MPWLSAQVQRDSPQPVISGGFIARRSLSTAVLHARNGFQRVTTFLDSHVASAGPRFSVNCEIRRFDMVLTFAPAMSMASGAQNGAFASVWERKACLAASFCWRLAQDHLPDLAGAGAELLRIAADLGASLDESGALRVNLHQQTSVPGIYAAGDNVRGLNQVVVAAAEAAVAATDIHNQLRAAGYSSSD